MGQLEKDFFTQKMIYSKCRNFRAGKYLPKITIRAFGSFQQLLDSKLIETNTTAKTFKELIEFLSKNFNLKIKNELLDSNECLNLKYQIFINGKNILLNAGLASPINDGDVIIFSSVVDGG